MPTGNSSKRSSFVITPSLLPIVGRVLFVGVLYAVVPLCAVYGTWGLPVDPVPVFLALLLILTVGQEGMNGRKGISASLRTLGLVPLRLRDAAVGLALSLPLCVLALISSAEEGPASLAISQEGLGWLVCGPIAEEVVFRGYLFRTYLRRSPSVKLAAMMTSVAAWVALHAAFHPQGAWAIQWAYLVALGLFGTVQCVIIDVEGATLWRSIGGHCTYNYVAVVMLANSEWGMAVWSWGVILCQVATVAMAWSDYRTRREVALLRQVQGV